MLVVQRGSVYLRSALVVAFSLLLVFVAILDDGTSVARLREDRPSHAYAVPRENALPPRAEAKVVPRRRYVVAAIGDSITDPRVHGGLYMKHLAERCPKSRFDTYGIGGQFVRNLRARFDDDVFGAKKPGYTHVIVFGGVNDLIGNPTATMLADAERDLAAMYEDAHARGVRVIALTIAQWSPHSAYDARMTESLDAWILSQSQDGDVTHAVDVRVPLMCEDQGTVCLQYRRFPIDTVHWNDRGHQVVADAIFHEVFADCE